MRRIITPEAIISVPEEASIDDISASLFSLLHTEPWVRFYVSSPDISTQWTVLERGLYGIPVKIASEEFDGEVRLLQ